MGAVFPKLSGQRPCPGRGPKATVKPKCHNRAGSASLLLGDRDRSTMAPALTVCSLCPKEYSRPRPSPPLSAR